MPFCEVSVCAQCDAYAPVSTHTRGDQTFVAPAHPVPCTIRGVACGGGLRDGSRGRGSSQSNPYTSTGMRGALPHEQQEKVMEG